MIIKSVLNTDRLILRALDLDDFDAVHSWASNPENVRFMSFGPNTEADTKAFLENAKPGVTFAAVLKDSETVIGSCGIKPSESGYSADIGWVLHMEYWKNGYGTELGRELIRYGFEDLGLSRITASCAAANYGSFRVMENCGMRLEASRRKSYWARVDKEWVDELQYAILLDDYTAARHPWVGKTVTMAASVSEVTTSKNVGSGSLELFATPSMIALMEKAACACLDNVLESNQASVGTKVNVEHVAASGIGSVVTVTAIVSHVNNRTVEFSVTAMAGSKLIGKGQHTRVIVDSDRIMLKAAA